MSSREHFTVPPISTQQVSEFSYVLDPTKATAIDGISSKILKMAANILTVSMVTLQITDRSQFYQLFLNYLKRINKHIMGYFSIISCIKTNLVLDQNIAAKLH